MSSLPELLLMPPMWVINALYTVYEWRDYVYAAIIYMVCVVSQSYAGIRE